MKTAWTFLYDHGKAVFVAGLLLFLVACSVNPATGQKQFTALMSPAQEIKVGAQEHQKIVRSFGILPSSHPVQIYVSKVGQKVAVDTERPDVRYQFFVLDSPTMNAFALPGGYVYVTRGLLAQANSEAELASVLAHEIAHITARHSAERYSRGVLTTLGAIAVAAAADSSQVAQAAGIGSDLYIKSYSRQQESQADELGIRYLHRAGYTPEAMASFLSHLGAHDHLQGQITGRGSQKGLGYFSTHPHTQDRVVQAKGIASQYPQNANDVNRDRYLQAIDGITYGDSEKQGFARGQDFYHPQMGFTFKVPSGFTLNNQPQQIVATSPSGAIVIFDAAANQNRVDPLSYMTKNWMREQQLSGAERITINGMEAATASFPGKVSGRDVTIRIVAIAWSPDRFFRFQMATPRGASASLLDELKRTTYSVRPMTAQEKQTVKPYRLKAVTAQAGDTIASLSRMMPFDDHRELRLRVLNGLAPAEQLVPGRRYKMISSQ